MKYILVLFGIATVLVGCLIVPATSTALDLILLALVASVAVLCFGFATVAHAIDKHREKMEDLAITCAPKPEPEATETNPLG